MVWLAPPGACVGARQRRHGDNSTCGPRGGVRKHWCNSLRRFICTVVAVSRRLAHLCCKCFIRAVVFRLLLVVHWRLLLHLTATITIIIPIIVVVVVALILIITTTSIVIINITISISIVP